MGPSVDLEAESKFAGGEQEAAGMLHGKRAIRETNFGKFGEFAAMDQRQQVGAYPVQIMIGIIWIIWRKLGA